MSTVYVGNVNEELTKFLDNKNFSQIAFLVDENTKNHCYPLLKNLPNHHLISIKAGEQHKDLATCTHIWEQLTVYGFDRKGLLINLGGGVIGDMGGFCARTFKRGINFINIPTTLLAQVDASVGGKLGIDFNGLKNHIGLFSLPDLVIIDTQFLKSLPLRQLQSGFAEVIKHNLIADSDGWNALKLKEWDNQDWNKLVSHSVRIKEEIVNNDPTERGQRKILNFGHTMGHAIESYLLPTAQSLLHGEAIAIGMICEAHISFQKGMIQESDLNEITHYISKVYGKFDLSGVELDAIIELMGHDKKNEKSKILCVLLSAIGNTQWDIEISSDEIKTAFEYYYQI